MSSVPHLPPCLQVSLKTTADVDALTVTSALASAHNIVDVDVAALAVSGDVLLGSVTGATQVNIITLQQDVSSSAKTVLAVRSDGIVTVDGIMDVTGIVSVSDGLTVSAGGVTVTATTTLTAPSDILVRHQMYPSPINLVYRPSET